MSEQTGPERIGRALQAMAADLAKEQRRVMRLRRENRELKARLAALQKELGLPLDLPGGTSSRPGSEGRRDGRSSGESTLN